MSSYTPSSDTVDDLPITRRNYKGALQQGAQRRGREIPQYSTYSLGPRDSFKSTVWIGHDEHSNCGTFPTEAASESEVARIALLSHKWPLTVQHDKVRKQVNPPSPYDTVTQFDDTYDLAVMTDYKRLLLQWTRTHGLPEPKYETPVESPGHIHTKCKVGKTYHWGPPDMLSIETSEHMVAKELMYLLQERSRGRV